MHNNLKVLMIDSSNTAYEKLIRCSEGKSIDIVARATNRMEAIELFLEHQPDVVTLDTSIPKIDSIKCIERLKSIDENVTIVLVSSYKDIETSLLGISKGAVGFLQKPFTCKELFGAVLIKPSYGRTSSYSFSPSR